MTNLSKELCEICGIAYTITEDNCRVYDNDGELCEQYVYKLDFEQPTNEEIQFCTGLKDQNGELIYFLNGWNLV